MVKVISREEGGGRALSELFFSRNRLLSREKAFISLFQHQDSSPRVQKKIMRIHLDAEEEE